MEVDRAPRALSTAPMGSASCPPVSAADSWDMADWIWGTSWLIFVTPLSRLVMESPFRLS